MTLAPYRLAICALVAGLMLPAVSNARATTETSDCFDVLVSARPVEQIPTAIPECDDCIVMSWPWILDLDIEQVIKGHAPGDRLKVLNVQHTYLRADRWGRWWLRRNTLGVFNALRPEEGTTPRRCPKGTPPARPFVSPGDGQTLDDLERESERLFGRHATP